MSDTRKKPGRYDGVLSKRYGGFLRSDFFGEEGRHRAVEFLEQREIALFEHFGIERTDDVDSWRRLARALAASHVPAFQKPRGRPKASIHEGYNLATLYHMMLRGCDTGDRNIYQIMSDEVSFGRPDLTAQKIKNKIAKFKKDDRQTWLHAEKAAHDRIEAADHPIDAIADVANALSLNVFLDDTARTLDAEINQWPQSRFPDWWPK